MGARKSFEADSFCRWGSLSLHDVIESIHERRSNTINRRASVHEYCLVTIHQCRLPIVMMFSGRLLRLFVYNCKYFLDRSGLRHRRPTFHSSAPNFSKIDVSGCLSGCILVHGFCKADSLTAAALRWSALLYRSARCVLLVVNGSDKAIGIGWTVQRKWWPIWVHLRLRR